MHVAIAWDHKPLLLLATALLPNRTTASFESEAGPPQDKQRIQMGLRSGNTVLICLCENHARKMRTFFTRRLEPKTRSSYHIKWSNAK